MRPIVIALGVPSNRGSITTQTAASLLRLASTAHELGIRTNLVNIDCADVIYARNSIGTYVYENDVFSHLLFVDDDMEFEAEAIIDLLRADKPIIGCICPKRELDTKALYEAARAGLSFEDARSRALKFITKTLPDTPFTVKDGLTKLAGIGMGITLIRREVFTDMVAKGAAVPRDSQGTPTSFDTKQYVGFFDQLRDVTGDLLSEDLSFCHRWTQLGGEIWGLASRQIGHVGVYNYKGAFLDQARTLAA